MKHVLSMGQCAADGPMIASMLRQHFDAETTSVATEADAARLLRERGFDLVLVNRILDADGASGLEVLQHLKSDEMLRHVPVMLVSNFADAQQQAVAAGALPGFGKAALHDPETVARLRKVLGEE